MNEEGKLRNIYGKIDIMGVVKSSTMKRATVGMETVWKFEGKYWGTQKDGDRTRNDADNDGQIE